MPTGIDFRRYRKVRRFVTGVFIHVVWWDVMLNVPGLRRFRRPPLVRYQAIARRYRALAGEMGGVLIKLGQFLSTRVDILPPEITRELAGLQDEVPPGALRGRRAPDRGGLRHARSPRSSPGSPRSRSAPPRSPRSTRPACPPARRWWSRCCGRGSTCWSRPTSRRSGWRPALLKFSKTHPAAHRPQPRGRGDHQHHPAPSSTWRPRGATPSASRRTSPATPGSICRRSSGTGAPAGR